MGHEARTSKSSSEKSVRKGPEYTAHWGIVATKIHKSILFYRSICVSECFTIFNCKIKTSYTYVQPVLHSDYEYVILMKHSEEK